VGQVPDHAENRTKIWLVTLKEKLKNNRAEL